MNKQELLKLRESDVTDEISTLEFKVEDSEKI